MNLSSLISNKMKIIAQRRKWESLFVEEKRKLHKEEERISNNVVKPKVVYIKPNEEFEHGGRNVS